MKLSEIEPGTHMCLIYSDIEESQKQIYEFLSVALKLEGRVNFFNHESQPDHVRSNLKQCGCSDHAIENNLNIVDAEKAYTPNGSFDKDEMKNTLIKSYIADCEMTNGPVHISGEMSWALKHSPNDLQNLMQYESEVNTVCEQYPFSACCCYDAGGFDAETIMNVMAVHPYLLIKGMIVKSPYYEKN